MHDTVSVPIGDVSAVGGARRAVAGLAATVGLSAERASDAAIVVTEAATNIARHAGAAGEIVLRPLRASDTAGLEILALDRGRGIANLAEARRDGYSTAGSPGEGLGAMARQATEFDCYSSLGHGTIVFARIWNTTPAPPIPGLDVGAICLPKPGEAACGDNWSVVADRDRLLVVVADGLGHGLHAADASRRVLELVRESASLPPVAQMTQLHAGLRSTRGAAVALVDIRPERGELAFVGVGNIGATLLDGERRRSLVSHNGTIGAEARRIQEFKYAWSPRSLLVVHSDGLSSNWDLSRYPGLRARHCAVAGAVLYRDHRRIQDDATVVTIARPAGA
jgi:anti-sigma regulatory factor (Ser/Thr protein kinase)